MLSMSCEPAPRDLEWVVSFGPGVDPAAAVRVETQILGEGCAGRTTLYRTNITPDSPTAGPPGRLPPGTYGFAATATDANCVPYATTCAEVALPLPVGALVSLTLAADPAARPGCRADECMMAFCGGPPRDAGPDAPDGAQDAGDASAPPLPIVVAQGVAPRGAVDIVAPTTSVLIAAGMNMHRQTGDAGGYVGSILDLSSTRQAGTVVERVATDGNDLYANSALVSADLGFGARVEHLPLSEGYDLISERWAWAALAADSIWTAEDHRGGVRASTPGTAPEDVVAVVFGAATAATRSDDATVSLSVGVDGTDCASATHLGVAGANPRTAGASFFCILALAAGDHEFTATLSGNDLTPEETTVGYVMAPRDEVPVFGNSISPTNSLRLPSAGVLVAFAAAEFVSSGSGWGEVGLQVDAVDCGRVRSAGSPTRLTATCVWPVTSAGWVSLSASVRAEGGVSPDGMNVGWAFFASE